MAGLKSSHVLIAGTGRAGTSFLMQLLTNLEFETGFTRGVKLDSKCNAGLESDLSNYKHWPYIVKNPEFSFQLDRIRKKVDIDFIIIPVRESERVAQSRERVGKGNGGFWKTSSYEGQMGVNSLVYQSLTEDLTKYKIPHMYLWFDDMITDMDYLYNCLSFIFDINYNKFEREYRSLVDINKINF